MTPVEKYLQELREIRSSGAGVKETTYYTALANLLDEVGKTIKPRVRCIQQLKNVSAGSPDMGLYSADQFPKHSSAKESRIPPEGGVPSRGVIEIKSTSKDAWVVAGDLEIAIATPADLEAAKPFIELAYRSVGG